MRLGFIAIVMLAGAFVAWGIAAAHQYVQKLRADVRRLQASLAAHHEMDTVHGQCDPAAVGRAWRDGCPVKDCE